MSRAALGLAALALLGVPSAAQADVLASRLAALRVLTDRPVSAQAPRVRSTPRRSASIPSGFVCAKRARHADEVALRLRTEAAVRDAAVRFDVDPRLIRSVIRHESAGNPLAESHMGAMGLMQLMPATARELGVVCPWDARENVMGGTRYLRQLRDELGSWERAVVGYHAGPHRVRTGRIGPETKRYVRRVLGSWRPGRSVTLPF